MATTKRVGILTGGGDVPGLNMCLKSLVYRLIDLGYEDHDYLGWHWWVDVYFLDPPPACLAIREREWSYIEQKCITGFGRCHVSSPLFHGEMSVWAKHRM